MCCSACCPTSNHRVEAQEFRALRDQVADATRFLGRRLRSIEERLKIMSPALQALSDQVAANAALESSAVTLIHGLADQIAAAKDDPAAIAALSAELKSSADTLAAAVSANTPAAPAPVTPVDVPPTDAAPVE